MNLNVFESPELVMACSETIVVEKPVLPSWTNAQQGKCGGIVSPSTQLMLGAAADGMEGTKLVLNF